jgi:beta-glucuronidase
MRSVEYHEFLLPSSEEKEQQRISSMIRRPGRQNQHQHQQLLRDTLWIWRCYFYPQRDLKSVQLIVELVSKSDYTGPVNDISIYFDDQPDETITSQEMNATQSQWSKSKNSITVDLGIIEVPNPRIWSTDDPQLHTVSITMNNATVTERFGLRYWDIVDEQIRLNGRPIKLVGWNHHTQWPDTAASPTDRQLDDDMFLLKQEGHVNFVRGAHYPQDPRWLDRLDEQGIVMWCETLGPNVAVKDIQSPYFMQYQTQQMNEMLDNAMNHPSIAFWAFFNEGQSDEEDACLGYQANADTILARDSTRFITYASNRAFHDKCYDSATVVSHNGYPGWYSDGDPVKWWSSVASMVSRTASKPFIISETGAAGIYEWTHNDTVTKWTLEYQKQIITQDVDHAIGNPSISGIALWHFFDFKVNDGWENNTACDYLPNVTPPTCGYIDVDTTKSTGRPGGLNHKGVLDYYRRAKPIFPIVAAKFKNVTQPTITADVTVSLG